MISWKKCLTPSPLTHNQQSTKTFRSNSSETNETQQPSDKTLQQTNTYNKPLGNEAEECRRLKFAVSRSNLMKLTNVQEVLLAQERAILAPIWPRAAARIASKWCQQSVLKMDSFHPVLSDGCFQQHNSKIGPKWVQFHEWLSKYTLLFYDILNIPFFFMIIFDKKHDFCPNEPRRKNITSLTKSMIFFQNSAATKQHQKFDKNYNCCQDPPRRKNTTSLTKSRIFARIRRDEKNIKSLTKSMIFARIRRGENIKNPATRAAVAAQGREGVLFCLRRTGTLQGR